MQGKLEKRESRKWVVIENKGLNIFGVLHRPTEVNHPPLVIVLHGFASSKHGSNRCYVTLAEHLASAGIATLRFDFRGSGDSEGSLSEASLSDLIDDALAVTDFAASLEGIDSDRLGVFGASLGGGIAIEAVSRSSKVKSLALWAPVASGELWYRDFLIMCPEMKDVDPTQAVGKFRGIQLNQDFRQQFATFFPYKTLTKIPHISLLHMHGEKDATISIAHQEAFKMNAGKNAKFVVYSDEQHSLGFAKIFPEVIQETVSFFKDSLK